MLTKMKLKLHCVYKSIYIYIYTDKSKFINNLFINFTSLKQKSLCPFINEKRKKKNLIYFAHFVIKILVVKFLYSVQDLVYFIKLMLTFRTSNQINVNSFVCVCVFFFCLIFFVMIHSVDFVFNNLGRWVEGK